MQKKKRSLITSILLSVFVLGSLTWQLTPVLAAGLERPQAEVAPWELISAMNALRMGNGLPPLIEDPIVNAVAQSTAQIMADTLASWHIGDPPGRLQAAGYGGGARVLATENFAVGSDLITLDLIMFNYWNDATHMLPAVTPGYCHIGAGSAKASDGSTYFVLLAAGIAGQVCAVGDYPVIPIDPNNPNVPVNPSVPQIIIPVEKVNQDENGNYLHTVKAGQSFWSIAVAYGVTGDQIRAWNNLPQSYILQPGDTLTIPGPTAQNYATPTPSNQLILASPEVDGRVVHVVKIYQNLEIIAKAYGVSVESLLALNNWSVDWPLQVEQKLLIKAPNWTPTPTDLPLSPIERLTPAADGKYYHVVKDGQNPQWIADYYGVSVNDLLAWNPNAEVIYPGERLLLQITPPATATPLPSPTPVPPTETPQPTSTPRPTATPMTTIIPEPTAVIEENSVTDIGIIGLGSAIIVTVGAVGYFLMRFLRNRRS